MLLQVLCDGEICVEIICCRYLCAYRGTSRAAGVVVCGVLACALSTLGLISLNGAGAGLASAALRFGGMFSLLWVLLVRIYYDDAVVTCSTHPSAGESKAPFDFLFERSCLPLEPCCERFAECTVGSSNVTASPKSLRPRDPTGLSSMRASHAHGISPRSSRSMREPFLLRLVLWFCLQGGGDWAAGDSMMRRGNDDGYATGWRRRAGADVIATAQDGS